MSYENAEIIEMISSNPDPLFRWQPIIGSETEALREHLEIPEFEKDRLIKEAVNILSRCVPPSGVKDDSTGLVIGYVQSGKTMSFTALTALARDNGYQFVIVIAGTSTNLLGQSTKRLKRDLRLDTRDDRKWRHFESKHIKKSNHLKFVTIFKDTLQEWKDEQIPVQEKKTVLLTVMKNHAHLSNVQMVLSKLNLDNVPVLVIDDEADQASLNTSVNKGKASTTYERIISLRNCLPSHTFLQYTATPQAPLLINIIDALSPKFVNVISPGEGYRGAKTFFIERPELVTVIPDDELHSPQYENSEPPESLIRAMRIFFLGVAAGLITDGERNNRSMMVHPSHKTFPHDLYSKWIERIRTNFINILSLQDDDYDKNSLLTDFRESFSNLQSTSPELPFFEQLTEKLLRAIRLTQIEVVNAKSGSTPIIDWKNTYSHILVGGQAMDRGFTVEGLTVTYMPRGTGTGNVDTILQRARFFGYKADYINYCRIFLERKVFDAYQNLVKHEEDIRKRLIDWSLEGRTLAEWKRAFFLDVRLKPTRSSVIDIGYKRGNFTNKWYSPGSPHESLDAVEENRNIVNQFINSLDLKTDQGHKLRTDEQIHYIAEDISLQNVIEKLLIPYRVTRPKDSEPYTGIRLQINSYIEKNPNARCVIYQMSQGKSRLRSLDKSGEIPTLFQGKNPQSGKGETIYPGDSLIRDSDQLTVQIHNIKVRTNEGRYIDNVPVIAIWVPSLMGSDWLIQDQGIS